MKEIVQSINDIIWSPALVVLLVGAGLYFSIGTGFVQIRRFGLLVKNLFPKRNRERDKVGISSFEAFCIALSGRVGTGNIVGVATAIAFGGPGAVFWMWVVAFLGASTAFAESTLAQVFKVRLGDSFKGGPAFYITNGLKCKWLGVLFAIATIIGAGIFSTTIQSNGMANAMANAFGCPLWLGGVVLAFFCALVTVGGVKRIASVAGIITPFMSIMYVLLSLVVIAINWRAVPAAFGSIFAGAFGLRSAFGGILGSTIMMGVKRGLFSNEAGEGTGAIPSASANVEHPAQQGLAQAFSVYVDTLLVCTGTALMIITTGSFNVIDQNTGKILVENVPSLADNCSAFTQYAISSSIGEAGNIFIGIAMVFFVFTTVFAYYFYAESNITFLCGNDPKKNKRAVLVFQILFFGAIIFGSTHDTTLVWTLADIGIGSMAWINVISILILSPIAFRALREYEDIHRR